MSQFPQRTENRIAVKPLPITTIVFDYSCVLSLAPQPEDYESLRQAIGVEAAALQEISWRNRDAYDREVNINAAHATGMRGIAFRSVERL